MSNSKDYKLEKFDKHVGIKLTKTQLEALQKASVNDGLNISVYIRQIIREKLLGLGLLKK